MGAGIFELRGFVAEGLRDQGRAEGRDQGRAVGQVEGQISSLLHLLELRGLPLTPQQHHRITTCDDTELLSLWFSRAVTAQTAADIFAPADADD